MALMVLLIVLVALAIPFARDSQQHLAITPQVIVTTEPSNRLLSDLATVGRRQRRDDRETRRAFGGQSFEDFPNGAHSTETVEMDLVALAKSCRTDVKDRKVMESVRRRRTHVVDLSYDMIAAYPEGVDEAPADVDDLSYDMLATYPAGAHAPAVAIAALAMARRGDAKARTALV